MIFIPTPVRPDEPALFIDGKLTRAASPNPKKTDGLCGVIPDTREPTPWRQSVRFRRIRPRNSIKHPELSRNGPGIGPQRPSVPEDFIGFNSLVPGILASNRFARGFHISMRTAAAAAGKMGSRASDDHVDAGATRGRSPQRLTAAITWSRRANCTSQR